MITVVCWLWSQEGTWAKYNQDHVYRLKKQIEDNTSAPHRFVCITDGSFPLDGVDTHPLPDLGYNASSWQRNKYPQCFNRLWAFSEEAGNALGDIISIDLDVQICGNIDHILTREEDFIINKGNSSRNGYSGGMWKLNAGARQEVWERLNQEEIESACTQYTGSDQAWMRYVLGDKEPLFTEEDGVYHHHYIKNKRDLRIGPPENCSMMFFAGRIKPEDVKYKWVE